MLDFSALNQITYRGYESEEEIQKRDELIESGFTFLEGEKLPFSDPPPIEKSVQAEATPGNTPVKVEVKQLFSLQDAPLLCELYMDGKIELLEKIRILRSAGAVYAHFLCTVEDAPETRLRGDISALTSTDNGELF